VATTTDRPRSRFSFDGPRKRVVVVCGRKTERRLARADLFPDGSYASVLERRVLGEVLVVVGVVERRGRIGDRQVLAPAWP
jgi:hypothetical protein